MKNFRLQYIALYYFMRYFNKPSDSYGRYYPFSREKLRFIEVTGFAQGVCNQ